MRRTRPLVVVLVLATAACGSGSHVSTKRRTTTTSSSTSSTTTTTAPSGFAPGALPSAAPCFAGSAGPVQNPLAPATRLLSDVAASAGACFDRVTFRFRTSQSADFSSPAGTASPSYKIEYRPGPFADAASGAPHPVEGAAFLVVRFEPAAVADLSRPGAPVTYTGPKSVHPTGRAFVRDLELTDSSEGVVTWVIGLDQQRPFRVDTAQFVAVVSVG